jgi:FkbM family methyltransferase
MNLLLRLAAFAARILPDSLKQAIYRIKPLAGFLRKELNRAAPEELTVVQVAAGGLMGYSLELNLQLEKDYWLGTYELDLQQAVDELVQPGWVVYDVGANIGYISLMLARQVGETGRVFAFEALPANVQRLRRNIGLNELQDRVHVISAAVVDQAAPVHFLVHPSTSMGKVVGSAGRDKIQEYQQEIEVMGLALDGFVYEDGHPAPQVIKLDIEGGEVLAVKGMQRILAELRPLMLVELHGYEAARAVWPVLASAGYTIHRMQADFPKVDTVDMLDWKAYIIGKP